MSSATTNILIVILISVCVLIYITWMNSRSLKETVKKSTQQRDLVVHDRRALQLCRAIRILNPNVKPGVDYIIKHDSPGTEPYIAEWIADTPRPTEAELKDALQEVADAHHEDKYAAMRRADYPSVEEQLDAAYQARHGNMAKQIEVDERIRRVKEKYPKGEECF